jgi:hypothetical protein
MWLSIPRVWVLSVLLAGCGAPVVPVEEVDEVDEVDVVDAGAPEGATVVLSGDLPPVERFFELRYETGWNMHADFGAMNKHLSSKVVLELRGQNVARIVDQGEQRDSVLDDGGYEEDLVSWRNVWLGKWSEGEGALTLELEPCERECEQVRTEVTEHKTTKKCPELRAELVLECDADEVKAGPDPASAEADKSPQEVWICFPAGGDADLGGSPPSWVFGRDSCLEIGEGPLASPRVYTVCKP